MNTPETKSNRILIIDDDPHHNRIMSALLRSEGYDVQIGWNSVQAVHKNFDYKPDLVLLDVMMPGFAGTSACAALRYVRPDLPIVMVSAKTAPEDVTAGYDFGCTRYLTKPVDHDLLLRTVRDLLAGAAQKASE